ncbi:MAG: hypothetical protein MSA82_02890 [Oscillospiraceae bacterium]|nr:hypothetical protein [Oscillospiraceae bacterium]
MTKQTESKRPVNIRQEPSVDALAEIVARLIRAQEQGVKLRKEAEAE